MVRVTVTDPITKKVHDFYMDDRLKRNLDKFVKPALGKQDEDYVMIIDGKERKGKSVLGMQLGKYIDPSLSIDRVCFSPNEFRQAIIGAHKGQCVIFDEAYRGFGAAGALSEVNRILKSMMMEMGQKNLFVIVILPTFYLLEKYVALWRARGLLHVFQKGTIKGYWTYFNGKKKQMLYLNPNGKKFYSYHFIKTGFKGRFYNKYVLDEQAYRLKKAKSFKGGFKTMRSDRYKEQRDRLVYCLHKEEGLTLRKLSELFAHYNIKIKKDLISEILSNSHAKQPVYSPPPTL